MPPLRWLNEQTKEDEVPKTQVDLDEDLKEQIKAMTNQEIAMALDFHLRHVQLLLLEVDSRLEEIQRR